MIRIFLFTLTVLVLASVAHAQTDWGCGGPCNTYDAMQNDGFTYDRGYTPGQYSYDQSLNSQRFEPDTSMDYCCDFTDQSAAQARSEESQWRLRDLYQNQQPAACGPAFDPRAREGC